MPEELSGASKMLLREPPGGRRPPQDGLPDGLQGLKTPRNHDLQKEQSPLSRAPAKIMDKNKQRLLFKDCFLRKCYGAQIHSFL